MERELICKWLGLPSKSWPPDHYTLLGLPVGEADVRKIEEHTHDRLICLRQHQLHHPDQVTEAMNRLAQAFSCLTDPMQKQAYDAALRPAGGDSESTAKSDAVQMTNVEPAKMLKAEAPAPSSTSATPDTVAAPSAPPEPAPATAADSPDPLAWLFGPWSAPALKPTFPTEPPPNPAPAPAPAVVDWKTEPPPARLIPGSDETTATAPAPLEESVAAAPNAAPAPPTEPIEPTAEAARYSRSARRGLGTKRAMYHRIATTRQLIGAWQKTGRYLARPDRRLTRLAEANDLIRELAEIQELLEDFPPLLGEAGQPGYLVLALAKQPLVVPTFRALLPSQREALARDWNAALTVLLEHRRFLRAELRTLRKKNFLARGIRALRAFLNEHALPMVLATGLIALLLAVWSYYRYRR